MMFGDAQLLKDETLRSAHGLEKFDEMPQVYTSTTRKCRLCQRPSNFRCAACRTAYCCTLCQCKDWKNHLFVCCVQGRPNNMDYLQLACRHWQRAWQTQQSRAYFLKALFSDDSLCKAFGFNNCLDEYDVSSLLCLYSHILRSARSAQLQNLLERQYLGAFIQELVQRTGCNWSPAGSICSCVPWFLQRRQQGFDIPHLGGPFLYQTHAWTYLEERFNLWSIGGAQSTLSAAERAVLSLYSMLLRGFGNIPEPWMSEWLDFGFCFCESHSQRQRLAIAYLDLLDSGVSLDRIAKAWERSSLGPLMHNVGINIAALDSDGIELRSPHWDEIGVYRLIAEVNHVLSGCYCPCFKSACSAHSKYETFLSRESEGDYGFHGASPWERWQLLNFYRHVFAQPTFSSRAMQKARRNPDPGALEAHLNSIVQDFRRKIGNLHLADAMFPKLKARVTFPDGRPPCDCVIHTVLTPEGLDMRCFRRILFLRGEAWETSDKC